MAEPLSGAAPWIDRVAEAIRDGADRVLLMSADDPVDGGWTGQEFARRIAGAARLLDDAHCPTATVLPALLSTSPESMALVVAGAATGRPLAPLSPRLTLRELAGQLSGLDSDFLLCEPESLDVGRALAQQCGRRVLVTAPLPVPTGGMTLRADGADTAFVLHTSGTTGRARRVDIRQDRMGIRAALNARLMRLGPDSIISISSPFHHVGGLGALAVALAAGSRIVAFRGFSIDSWAGLHRLGVTHAQAVPSMIEILLRAGTFALPTLRLLQYGAAPMHPDTLRRAMTALPRADFVNLFGQTEGAPLTCLTPEDHRRAVRGDQALLRSVGKPIDEVELVVHEPDVAGVGEVRVRGAHLFRPEADGWLHTGDLGRLDDRGYLYLVGRKGDMIIRGGENVYPLEVEQTLAQHADVVEAAVVGVPDLRVGEMVKAFVVPRDPATPPDPQELRSFAREALAGFKVPELWEFLPELPRNPNGKVLRRALIGRAGGCR